MQTRSMLLALGVLAGSCRGCRDKCPDNPLDLPSADATAAFVVPELSELLAGADAFASRATKRAGGKALGRLRASFKTQFGFDPFSAEEYEALGVDAEGSVVVFTEGESPEPLLAIALSDRSAFDKKLRDIIQKTDGASRYTEARQHGFSTVTAGRPFGDEVVPAFHWAYVGSFALVARDAGHAGFVAALARLGGSAEVRKSLRTDPVFRRLSRRVPAGTMRAFVRGSAGLFVNDQPAPISPGAVTSVTLGKDGITSETFVELAVPGLEQALDTPPPRELARWIAGDAAVVLLSRAARPEGIAALRAHPQLARLADEGVAMLGGAIGLDPETEVVPLLTGPMAASVHITDVADLPQRLKMQRTLQSLLDSFHIAIVAEISDRDAFLEMLARSRTELEKRGVPLRRRERDIGEARAVIFEPDREAPRLGWGLVDRYYVYGAGRGRVDMAMDAVVDQGPSLFEALDGSVGGELAAEAGTTVAVVRLGTIAEAASEITLNQRGAAIGIGALVGTLLQFVEDVGDVAAAVDAEPGGLRLRVRERLR